MDAIFNNIHGILFEYVDEIIDDQVNVLNISKASKEKLKDILYELFVTYVNIHNIINEYCMQLVLYLSNFDDTIYYDEFEHICRQFIAVFVK